MAKKKKLPEHPHVETFNANDIIDDKAIKGKEDANAFYVKVSIDRRLTPKQINDKLNEAFENARKRMVQADMKLKEFPTLPLVCDASYWRSYHYNLAQYIYKERAQKSLFKDNCEAKAIKAFENVHTAYDGRLIRFSPYHFKGAYIAFVHELKLSDASQTTFIRIFSSMYGSNIKGGKRVQVDLTNRDQISVSNDIIREYNKVK